MILLCITTGLLTLWAVNRLVDIMYQDLHHGGWDK
jgi:hypothetical protein